MDKRHTPIVREVPMTDSELVENIRKLVEEALSAAILTAVNLVVARVAWAQPGGRGLQDIIPVKEVLKW